MLLQNKINDLISLRYTLDNESQIVMVNGIAKCLKIQNNDFINAELLKNYQIYTLLIYNLNIYDEQNDSLLWLQASKVSKIPCLHLK